MAEHPTTSIDVDTERQDDKSTLAISKYGLINKFSVTPQNNYQSVLPSGDTNPLQKKTNPKNPKNHPIKKSFPKILNPLNILKQIFNKLKNTNRRITQMIILLPTRLGQLQVTTYMVMIKTTS